MGCRRLCRRGQRQNTRHTGNKISRAGTLSPWRGAMWIGAAGLLVVAVGWFAEGARILLSPLQTKGWTSYVLPGSNQDTQAMGTMGALLPLAMLALAQNLRP